MTTLQIAKNVSLLTNGVVEDFRYREHTPPVRGFRAAICKEDEGGFSIYALHVPGVVSQGETEAEAIDGIREAFSAMLESCHAHGEPLPYSVQPLVELNTDCRQLWIKVDG